MSKLDNTILAAAAFIGAGFTAKAITEWGRQTIEIEFASSDPKKYGIIDEGKWGIYEVVKNAKSDNVLAKGKLSDIDGLKRALKAN